MRHSRTAVTWTAASLLLVVVAGVVGVWGAVWSADSRARAWAAATVTTEGTAGAGLPGSPRLVAWFDEDGVEYRKVVPGDLVPDVLSRSVPVRYDPQDPLGAVFVGTDALTPPAPAGPQVALVVLVLAVPPVAWAVRWGRLLLLRRTPATVVHVQALLSRDDPTDPAVLRWVRRLRPQVWLRIGPPPGAEGQAAVRYQRVLWDPALAGLAQGGTATAHLPPVGGRRGVATVVLDGVVVMPVGRWRDRAPKTPLVPAVTRPWTWRSTGVRLTPVSLAVAATAVRMVLAIVQSGGLPSGAGAPAAVVLAALVAAAWLWAGPSPRLLAVRDAPVTG